MCFGVDGFTIFQGTKTRVIFSIKGEAYSLFIGVHYMAYHILLSQPFQLYPLLKKLKLCYN
jgi:hypothetical protein